MRDDTSGEFDGLGLELTVKDGELTVISPVVESPGERAGIRPGDRILSIEGAPTKDMTLGEATRRMKGAAGTKVTLEIMREGFTAPQKLIARPRPDPHAERGRRGSSTPRAATPTCASGRSRSGRTGTS